MKILMIAPTPPSSGGPLADHEVTWASPASLPDPKTGPWDLLLAVPPLPSSLASTESLEAWSPRTLLLDAGAPRLGSGLQAPAGILHPEDLDAFLSQMGPDEQTLDLWEMSSMLRMVLQALERLQSRSTLAPEEAEDLSVISQTLSEVTGVVQHLLAPHVHAPEGLIPLDFSAMVRDTLHLIRLGAPSQIDVQSRITSGLWVMGSPVRLQQTLVNLVLNAFHAMPAGGALTVALSETTVEGDPPQRGAFLQVKDSGCGMDAALLRRAFQPFFTTHGFEGSAGLGLSLARDIVLHHRGAIEAHSTPGQGTTLDITLPCLGEEQPLPRVPGLAPLKGIERLLLVEPDALLRSMAHQGLTGLGYKVTATATAEDALQQLKNAQPPMEAVFLELELPDSSGIDLSHRIRTRYRHLPIILLSPFRASLHAVRQIHTQFTDVVGHPFNPHDLARVLRRHLPVPGSPVVAKEEAAVEPAAAGPQATVLLAEDSVVTRGMVRRWLQDAGHRVLEARDGQEAWERFRDQDPADPISLVITDVVMPRLGGLELARLLRDSDPTLPIAVMTTVEDRETMKSALQAGVNEFLTKPFQQKDLSQTLDHLLAASAGRREVRRSKETAQAVRLAQRALLAVPEHDLPIYTLYEPLTDAGGDVFRAQRLPDGSIFFLLGDVAGHSVISSYAVASFLGMLTTFLGQTVSLRDLALQLNRGIQDGPFSEVPVCALLGNWHPGTGRLHLLNAGIPHGACLKGATREVDWLALNGTPLGILEAPLLDERIVQLQAGDRLIFGTDGFFEAVSPTRELFADQLPSQWAALKESPIQWALSLVSEAVRAHTEGVLTDDLLVIGFEQEPPQVDPNGYSRSLPNNASEIDHACEEIKRLLDTAETGIIPSAARRFDILLALREAMTNAMFHGNQNRPDAVLHVTARLATPRGPLDVRVLDEGNGFDLDRHIPPTDIDSERGRGIPLLRSCAQSLTMTASELHLSFSLEDQP